MADHHSLAALQLAGRNHYGRNIIPGTERTPYFYLHAALDWLRMSRQPDWPGIPMRETARRFALSYFNTWKTLKGKL